jgi:hypothetical protein
MPTFANNEALSSVRQKINAAIEDVEWGRGGFATVADLLSNSTLTNDGTLEGQIFTAGGFRYQRAASTATDHHVTTAGGVKLYVLPGADGKYNVAQLGDDVDAAFAALFPGRWVVSSDISLSADTTITLDDFSLETTAGAVITVNSGAGALAIVGDRSGVGEQVAIYGRLLIGGTGSAARTEDNFAGRIEVESLSADIALSFRWCSNLKVSAPFDVLLSGSNSGNNGVQYITLKQPWIAGGTVRGNVSLGYQYIGNATVAEPTIDGGYIGPQFTIKSDSYSGVATGQHGHYCKGCRNTRFGKIQVEGNGANVWGTNEYHVKLRDNENCEFDGIVAINTSHPNRLGRIFITSDGNTLAIVRNRDNVFRDIFGIASVFQSAPGVTEDNLFVNVYGVLFAVTAGARNVLSGRVEFVDSAITTLNNEYEFRFADVIAPHVSIYARPVVAHHVVFRQTVETLNVGMTLAHCEIQGNLRLDCTTGTHNLNARHVSVTGDLFTNSTTTRVINANLSHCSFGGNEPTGNSSPDNKNYDCVSFADRVYGSTGKAVVAASFTVANLPSGAAVGSWAYATDGRKAGEGAGSGTGVMVFRDASNWIAVDTGATVAA